MAAILARGRVPIVVGGSGLYVRAVLDRLEIPPTDPAVRDLWSARLRAEGVDVLYAHLREVDPAAAAAIEPRNGRRIVRALEVIQLTGRPFSATLPRREYVRPTMALGLRVARPVLDQQIGARVRRMWRQGLRDEVRVLEARGLRVGRTASKALGYRQALAELDGELTTEQAQDETASATRRFARRQASWFRPDPRVQWLEHDDPRLVERAVALVRAGVGQDGS